MLITTNYNDLKEIIEKNKFPLVICDIDAFNHNLEKVGNYLRKVNKSIRLCTKSVRVPELIKKVEEQDFVNGLFTYNADETLFFAEKYHIKDILLGYPTTSAYDAEELCKAASIEGVEITVMVDSTYHLNLLERAANKYNVNLSILIEVDVADNFLGTNIGVYRSPLREPEDVVRIAKEIESRPHLTYRGIMGYEAQNASLGDTSLFMRWIKKRSRKHVNQWRQDVVDALIKDGFEPEVVNGGGSGCFEETSKEASVTEIGIGSLLFKSHIFDVIDSLDAFIPSLFLVLQIVRKPKKNIVTAFSGGYVSSGAVRANPLPIKPEGLKTFKNEEFGEVQTPFRFNPRIIELNLGDPIFCRFGKAGEPLEHFNEVNIYSDGKIIDKVLTYRGLGYRFS
ncbi:MAG: alanine racemase [Candidatus Heimdallarchaeota archaeon]